MATAPMSADRTRMSFAKVAASAGKDSAAIPSFAKVAAAGSIRDGRKHTPAVSVSKNDSPDNSESINVSSKTAPSIIESKATISKDLNSKSESLLSEDSSTGDAKLVDAVKALNAQDTRPTVVLNGSTSIGRQHKSDSTEVLSEDPSYRADSGSDLGTKPPSLDGKSITSGTTFALDEKESLRPDDSASVKAAEDDDTFSGRGSIVAGSRIGSEAAGRAYRTQYYEADRRIQPAPERQNQGVNTPQSGSSGPQSVDDGKPKPLVGTAGAPDTFNLFYRQTPDEKLLEALESPKDRIFLLRLEQDVIEFVKDSKEPFIDLPPCNSFCRMLTHKLADYYHMTHQVDAVAGAVRIFRTPFCRLPPSLTSISNPPTSGNTPPPNLPTMKIMRRGADGDTGPSASKATSETGSETKEKALSAKEKLSREEREAAYNKARERIFGKDDKSGDGTPGSLTSYTQTDLHVNLTHSAETSDANGMSRSSSVSTKDKSSHGKRAKSAKQRRDDSESFDVRSQYTPFFPQPQQPTWVATPHYAPIHPQQLNTPHAPGGYSNSMVQYSASPPYNQTMVGPGNGQPYNNIPQPNQLRYQPHSAPITAYGSPVQSSLVPQQWNQNPYPSSYQAQRPVPGPPNTIPYAFGQLPSTANPADPKSQHPIPGSFNRHAFNPKTQSFVPGNPGMPIQHPMNHHGSPHLSYNGFPQQQFNNGMGYNMARQGSNNSLPSYHISPNMTHRPMMHQNTQQNLPQVMPASIPQGSHGVPHGMASTNQFGSHLPNFGNMSTLPPKPPTGI
ncbi:hypothetical protein F5884DRAFT_72573 [Xylogone sp. PMI_703]|nr:hypothetical protein F5884DRAFT_72573 [Xylogone sp. PMI_703]